MKTRPNSLAMLMSSLVLSAMCVGALAHHSRSRFDLSEMIEVEGELVMFSWRNPHVRIRVRTSDDAGNEVTWDMEGDSLSILRRTNAKPDGVEMGDQVTVAGYPTVRPSNDLLAYNLLTEDGREVFVNISAEPRWGGAVSGNESSWTVDGTQDSERGDIFRVWSTSFGPNGTFGIWRTDYPVTEMARNRLETWNPLVDTASPGCEPKGVPYVMEQPYPMEFVRKNDVIQLRLEEYDTVRTIYMQAADVPGAPVNPILGTSVGRWEGDTLVVETTDIDYPFFDGNGTPLGSDARITEKFSVSADNSRLEYELHVVDAEVFTEPVTLNKEWIWRPGESVEPYECAE